MDINSTVTFKLGRWSVNPATRQLSCGDQVQSLEPLPMKVLMLLVQRFGDVVSADVITEEVWGSNHVGESPVAHAIAQIRKTLGDDPRNPKFIETFPKTGYRLIAEVSYSAQPKSVNAAKIASLAFVLLFGIGLLWFSGGTINSVRSTDAESQTKDPVLVVLPLTNVTGNSENNFLTKGIGEELRHAIDRLSNVSIIFPYSTDKHLSQGGSIANVNQVLGASHTLDGALQGKGNDLKVVIRLIDNIGGVDLFKQAYSVNTSDLLTSQLRIASESSRLVGAKLGTSMKSMESALNPESTSKVTNIAAHQAYLEGQLALSLSTREGYFLAEQHFEQAVELDPDFALAWEALTRARRALLSRLYIPRDVAYARTLEASNQAINKAPNSATAWAYACQLRLTEMQDITGSKRYCQRAYEIDPNAEGVIQVAAQLALIEGDLDSAIGFYRTKVELDPLRAGTHAFLGLLLFFDGENDLAIESTQHALTLNPDQQMAQGLLGHIALVSDDHESAIEYFSKEAVPVYRLQGLAMAYFESGLHTQSETILNELTTEYSNDSAFQIAEVYGRRGDTEETIHWLERAIERNDGGLVFMAASPYLRFLHADSRYKDMLSRAFH